MNIIFDDFKEEYIYEATRLALCECERERKYNPNIPIKDYKNTFRSFSIGLVVILTAR